MDEKRRERETLYAYIDESGQDTKGTFFVVGIVVIGEIRAALLAELEAIERRSGKGVVKWHKSRPDARRRYMEEVSRLSLLRDSLFYEITGDGKNYFHRIATATAHAILKKVKTDAYRASIFVDGFTQSELAMLVPVLKEFRIKKRKLRGVRREENDAFIRLADALCGLVRDSHDKNVWSMTMLRRLLKRRLAASL